MSELITRTARLIPYSKRPKQVPSFVTAYMYEPQPDEPTAELGNLYIAIEVLVTGRASEEVADLVIEAFSDHYYNEADSKTPLERFESAVKSTNHQLSEFISQGNAAWIGKMSAIIAVVADSEIHLCQTGSADGYMYRSKSATRIITPNTKPAQPSKTFSSIVSGTLEAGDKLLFTTPALVHQIAMKRLHSIIAAHSPNAAISELTSLLPATGSERIGVLILEITTPELAALQIRSDQPDEIKLGQPENTYEAVKLAATPAAQVAIASSRRATAVASNKAIQLKPHLKRLGLSIVRFLREQLAGKRGGRRVLIAVILLTVFVGTMAYRSASSRELSALQKRYNQDYQLLLRAQAQAEAKETSAAEASLQTLQKDLDSLSRLDNRKKLESSLQKAQLPASQPRTIAAFISIVNAEMDKLNGLQRISTATIATLSKDNYSHIELANSKAYLFSSNAKDGISVVNISTKTSELSKANTGPLGTIVDTTLSNSGDGIYLLTKSPSVWFYKFDTDSVSEITLGGSAWESGSAISAYNGNLYILSDGIIYKHIKTFTGFSPKAIAVPKDATPSLSTSHGLAIDGTIYTLTTTGLQGYIAGVPSPLITLPSSLLSQNSTIEVTTSAIIITNQATKRIGILSTKGTAPSLIAQLSLNNVSGLQHATYDDATKVIIALAGKNLVQAKPSF